MGGFPPPPPEPEPELVVDKIPDGQTVSAGDPITFGITVTNQGEGVAEDVTITDQLPPALTWTVSQQPSQGTCTISSTALLTCTGLGDLALGDSRTVVVSAQTSFEDCAAYDNPAAQANAANDSATDGGSITCLRPDLVVQKTPDGQTVTAGDPIAFAITVINNGPGVARDVVLSDPLPPGPAWTITQQPAAGSCVIAGGTLTCDIGDLPAGTGIQVKVGAVTSATQCAVYNNTATATAPNQPEDAVDSGSITCSVVPPDPPIPPIPPDPPIPPVPPDPTLPPEPIEPTPPSPIPPLPLEPELTIEKVNVRRVVRAGERVDFRLTVRNTGNEVARNVTTCDRLPSGLVFASAANGTTRGRLQCFRVRRLRPGASATFVVYTRTARVEAESIVIVNTVWVVARGEGPRRDGARVRVLGERARRGGGVTG